MKQTRQKLDPHRCKTALILRRKTQLQVARAGGVSLRHFVYVITGQRPGSHRVYEALREAIGPDAWLFVIGQSDTLRDEGGADASA